jgi:quercetin dioxygenase-like cupin family protein
MPAFVTTPEEGERVLAVGCTVTVRVPSEKTGGSFGMVEFVAPPGFAAPPALHRHADIDWYAHVLEGSIAMTLDGSDVVVPTGGIVYIPRNTAFRWSNASKTEPARWLITYTPGGFERYFAELAREFAALGRPPTPADLGDIVKPLWRKHGIELA